MKSKRQNTKSVFVTQGSLNYAKSSGSVSDTLYSKFLAKVTARHSDRMTCDIQTTDGQLVYNVPMVTTAGLVDNKPYGIFDLPEIDDWVIVDRAGQGERKKVIVGTFIPYLTNEFNDDAVNSSNKAYTLKLLEAGKEMHYKRIFKSGTSVEIEEDGTIVVETPSGRYVRIDETAGSTVVSDPDGNSVTLDSNGIILSDTNGNTVTTDSSGIVLSDTNGNDVTMETGKVSINGNMEVAQ